MRNLVSETPVVVLGRRGCCMCHVVKRLLLGLGVNPAVCEVDDDGEEAAAPPSAAAVSRRVYWGRHVGGIDRLMAAHISGDLVPILKDAGALWL
ncbi:unnamed protein product [Spirodela intermedia]|uniref:Glutaredoxin domain-containing protein n=1 Tax=Spirodela intermedia TaxID=51605 RepID=A0A7I8ISY0_SPIIN|nr:unnamed protein product [Spirodela intermedia]CAA6661082.1 unnamed protein product [Spirodela intermedia]